MLKHLFSCTGTTELGISIGFRCRIHIELINWPSLQKHRGSPEAGLGFAIEQGWQWLQESGTYVKFTDAGSEPFA